MTEGGRSDTINASLIRSYLWPCCKLLALKSVCINDSATNMMSLSRGMNFVKWVLSIESVYPIDDIVSAVYDDLVAHYNSIEYPNSCIVVTPTNKVVTDINEHVLSKIPGLSNIYYNSDSIVVDGDYLVSLQEAHMVDLPNSQCFNSLPERELTLKLHTLFMILQNLKPSIGICNGLLITHLRQNFISKNYYWRKL
ncbi:hypothetical protein LINPERHAP2_LOCUS9593 [Linum perenne]